MRKVILLTAMPKESVWSSSIYVNGGGLLSSKISFSRILLLFVCCIVCNNVFAQVDDWRVVQDFESLTSSDVKACYSKDIRNGGDPANVVEYSGTESIFTDNDVTASISEDGVGTNSTKVAKLSKTKNDNTYSYGIVFRVSLGSNILSEYSKIKLDTYTDNDHDPLCVYVREFNTNNSFKKLFVLGNGFGANQTWQNMGHPDNGGVEELQITTTGMDYSDVEFYIGYTQSYEPQNVYIDNIQLYGPALGTVKIKEGEINTITAKENATVELYRTLTEGMWNTICLPFAPTPTQADAIFGEGAKFAQFSSVSNGVMQFTSVAGSLEAGKPYLVLPTKSQTADSPIVLTGVKIEATEPGKVTRNDDTGYYTFQGIYRPTPFTINDQSIRFVAANNKLKYPNTESPLKALRAYFKISPDAPTQNAKDYTFAVDSFVPTSIANIQIEGDGDGAIYNIGGQRVEGKSLPKGIYIRDGKKFVVK